MIGFSAVVGHSYTKDYFSSLFLGDGPSLGISPHWVPSPLCYLLGELAGLVRAVEDLIVKYGEVEGQPQPDGVGRLHFGFADLESVLVSFLRVIHNS